MSVVVGGVVVVCVAVCVVVACVVVAADAEYVVVGVVICGGNISLDVLSKILK